MKQEVHKVSNIENSVKKIQDAYLIACIIFSNVSLCIVLEVLINCIAVLIFPFVKIFYSMYTDVWAPFYSIANTKIIYSRIAHRRIHDVCGIYTER